MTLQAIKNYLVNRGPDDALVRTALKLKGLSAGYRVEFHGDRISLQRGRRRIVLKKSAYVQVPITMECFDQFFDSVHGTDQDGISELDFSQPGLFRYKRSGLEFVFPDIPEEDSMDAYVYWYTPKPGDVVWDVGAHAGCTSYFLAQMVGPGGRVYAFEPDEHNFEYMLRNIEKHKLTNVIPVKKALAGTTGTMEFVMDGTMSAGIYDYMRYGDKSKVKTVQTINFHDACTEFGSVPQYVKMDIEGSEVAVVQGAAEFLKQHPVHFSIESYHWVGDVLTYTLLDPFFPTIGYEVESSNKFGQMFTWARPKSAVR